MPPETAARFSDAIETAAALSIQGRPELLVELLRQIAPLVEKAYEDSARLDWLETREFSIDHCRVSDGPICYFQVDEKDFSFPPGTNLREAIDNARTTTDRSL